VEYTEFSKETMMEEDNKFPFFLLGLGVGVAVGILFAPKSGPETRKLLRDKADESKDYLLKRSEEVRGTASELIDKGKSALQHQKDQLAAAVDAGKQAYRETVNPKESGSAPAL
jgi:gas vesicle protein